MRKLNISLTIFSLLVIFNCVSSPPKQEIPGVGEIEASKLILKTEERILLSVTVSNIQDDTALKFTWKALNGKINPEGETNIPNATYTAPKNPGDDVVTVDVKTINGDILSRTITLKINEEISTEPIIRVTYPKNGDLVNFKEMVKGSAQNIQSDQFIWILVFTYTERKYYPQSSSLIRNDNSWSGLAQFGRENDDLGHQFDTVVILADQEAHDAFENYLSTERNNGISQLPDGVIIFDQISVTRK